MERRSLAEPGSAIAMSTPAITITIIISISVKPSLAPRPPGDLGARLDVRELTGLLKLIISGPPFASEFDTPIPTRIDGPVAQAEP
jgi:hypothetical protein